MDWFGGWVASTAAKIATNASTARRISPMIADRCRSRLRSVSRHGPRVLMLDEAFGLGCFRQTLGGRRHEMRTRGSRTRS